MLSLRGLGQHHTAQQYQPKMLVVTMILSGQLLSCCRYHSQPIVSGAHVLGLSIFLYCEQCCVCQLVLKKVDDDDDTVSHHNRAS